MQQSEKKIKYIQVLCALFVFLLKKKKRDVLDVFEGLRRSGAGRSSVVGRCTLLHKQ